jgi:hypothetical protein
MSESRRPQSLTERQITWCRKSFSAAWQAAQNADEHRLKVYEKLGVKPGAIHRKAA